MTAFDGTLIAVLMTFLAGVLGVVITGVHLVNLLFAASVIILSVTAIIIAAHYYGWKSDIFKIQLRARKKIPKWVFALFGGAAFVVFICIVNMIGIPTTDRNAPTQPTTSTEGKGDSSDTEPTEPFVRIGEIVSFGEYYQNNADVKEPIKWLVLDVQDNSVLVISQKLLDCKQFNEDSDANFWDTSTIRRWLQTEFANTAFSTDIQQKIIPTYTDGNTEDSIFLLSISEAEEYFSDSKAREAIPTYYAVLHGAGRDKDLSGGPGWWWLRSPGSDAGLVADVKSGGAINSNGYGVKSITFAVRPALWIDSSVLENVGE